MSTKNLEQNQLIRCHLCQRNYNSEVYKRHINENQCIKRNQHRLPFESIRQRSIQIGDKIFSVQQQLQQKKQEVQLLNNAENGKQQVSSSSKKLYQEKIPKIAVSNARRRTLEQAKQLLERRTKYQPPWIHKQSHYLYKLPAQLNRMNTITLPPKSTNPRATFKNEHVPNKISNIHSVSVKQPIQTHSPKLPISHTSTNYMEQTNSACQSTRKVSTWTRPLQSSAVRNVISPIHIPTFQDSSCGASHDHLVVPLNSNYNDDDDDEFERYSPTPPSTPKFQCEKTENKNYRSIFRKNVSINEQKTTKRRLDHFDKHSRQSTFHLPPIKPSSYAKLKQHPTINLTPWR
ncbi:unnamed protein product [Adineta ricciae]|uniref:Uncharacterized protein n=1 Tax=Adineta ricciae TaxID=249248 RepID=A0A814J3B6_ADIRI|nr:unnamed protein product [Adineta ricciae]CAF1345007.1 unnamed protein product [Adineta ricciae]